jgi:hypothetical protein
MQVNVKRTLVKSAPELWELADDLERMEVWISGLAGAEQAEVEVTRREPGHLLAWRAKPNTDCNIAIEMADSGFGTAVTITAQHAGESTAAEGVLERLLDELASPERRPFSRA